MQGQEAPIKEKGMTPRQLKDSTVKELIFAYKNKARCIHSENQAISIYNELKKRLGSEILSGIYLGYWHMWHGEGDFEFNTECDKLIKLL